MYNRILKRKNEKNSFLKRIFFVFYITCYTTKHIHSTGKTALVAHAGQ
jgi:hypothetical protein